MLLRDFTAGSVPTSYCKVMCDLAMYELDKNIKVDIKKEKEALANTLIQDLGDDIVGSYTSVLEPDVANMFMEIYKGFLTTFDLHGFNQVLISSTLLEDQVVRHLKSSRGLFGATLDNAVRKHVEYVANNFKVSEWDVNEHPNPFGLLNFAIKRWTVKGDYRTDKFFSNLQVNIVTNSDGDSEIMDSVVVEDNDTSDLFNTELYVELMTSIQQGSSVLFELARTSTLKEMLYSTINFYQKLEIDMIKDDLQVGDKKIIVDEASLIPYKSKKMIGFSEGHLPHMISSYTQSGIGNESSCNETFKSGYVILEALESSLNNIDLNNSVTFIVSDVVGRWDKSILQRFNQVEISSVIAAVLNTRRLKEILSSNGYNILQFPSIELRQKTWSRFNNLYELLNFYRTHCKLDKKIISPEFDYDTQSDVSIYGITIANVIEGVGDSGIEDIDRYIEDKFGHIKLSSRTVIKSRTTKVSYRPSSPSEKFEEAVWVTLKDDIVSLRKLLASMKCIANAKNLSVSMQFLEALIVPVLKYAGPSLSNYDLREIEFMELYNSTGDGKLDVDYRLQNDLLLKIVNDEGLVTQLRTLAQHMRNGLLGSLDNPITYYKSLVMYNEKIYKFQEAFLLNNDYYVSDGNGVKLSSINYINLMNYRFSEYLVRVLQTLLIDICAVNDVESMPAEELADSVFNNMFKDLTSVVLRVVNRPYIKDIALDDDDNIIKNFVNWYSDTYKLELTSMSRFNEFKYFELHPYNVDAISLVRRIVKLLVEFSDKFLYSNLTNAVKFSNTLSVWDSLKEFLNGQFLQASVDYLDDEINQQSMSYKDDTFCLKICPTIPGTTIIADPKNIKRPFITEADGANYWVYSNLGFKAKAPNKIDVPIKLSEEERNNLILAVGGLNPL